MNDHNSRRRGRFVEQETVDDWDGDTMDALKSPGPDPERQAFAGEVRALIESAIEALPEHYRAVFVMRAVEGMRVRRRGWSFRLTVRGRRSSPRAAPS